MILVAPGEDVQAVVAAAHEGEIVRLVAGVHQGPVRITHTLTLEGEPGASLVGRGKGTVLSVLADGVHVRNLALSGSGRDATSGDAGVLVDKAHRTVLESLTLDHVLIGLDLRQANDGLVRDCVVRGDVAMPLGMRGDGIRLWESNRNHIEGNMLESVRDVLAWYADDNWLVDNVIRDSRYGTHLMHTKGNVVAGNRYEDDVVGVFVMYSRDIDLIGNLVVGAHGAAGMGIGLKESDTIRVSGNRLLGNTVGIYLDTTPQRIGGSAFLSGNLLGYNATGLRFHGGQTGALVAANNFYENTLQVTVDGHANAAGTTFAGNAWSDFAAYDLDRDGYADLPYELRSVSGGLTDRRPSLSYFTGTSAAALLDLLGAAFPMFLPRPILHDAHPRLG